MLAHCPGLACCCVCARAPSPAMPSCLGHKHHSASGGGWSRCSSSQLWHDHKSHFSQSMSAISHLSQVQNSRQAAVPVTSGASHCTGLPVTLGPDQVHRKREGSHPMQTQFPRVPRDKQGTGETTEPPGCPPSLLPREVTWDCPQLAGASPDLSLLFLSKTHGAWIS